MKIRFALITFFLMVTCHTFCQTEVYRDNSVLDKVRQLQSVKATLKKTEIIEVQREVPSRRTRAEDSVVFTYQNYILTTNRVQLVPEKVKQIFPEAVSFTSEGDMEIDYFSMIVILFEAMGRQQAIIDELKKQVSILEGKHLN